MKIYSIAFLMAFSISSWALSPFQQHVQSTADALSAFYMYGLSEGDAKYLKDFNEYLEQADSALRLTRGEDKYPFISRWDKLKPYLEYKNMKTMGFYFERIVQIEARTYLTDIYLHGLTIESEQPMIIDKLSDLKLIISLLSNRALDIMTSNTGRAFLEEYGKKIVEEELINDVELLLNQLATLNMSATQKKLLNKVKIRFDFIRTKLMANDLMVPIYIVYSNVKSVDKLLRAAQNEVAVN